MVCGMAEQGGGGITIDCAILIATYSGGGVQESRCGVPIIVLTNAQSPKHQTNILSRPTAYPYSAPTINAVIPSLLFESTAAPIIDSCTKALHEKKFL